MLLNDVLKYFDAYWYDSKRSKKGKYVRSAAKSPNLRKLLRLINEKILAPHDFRVPDFIFGGLFERDNIQAAQHLLGGRDKIFLKMDIKSFFEQISEKRVFYFFFKHCQCTKEAATILSKLCCVPKGPRGSGETEKILARGFATSSRLAVWCNLNTFTYLQLKVRSKLYRNDPRIAIYVDDIGIAAKGVNMERMQKIKDFAVRILEKHDSNQPLPVHGNKTRIILFKDGAEYLGIKLGRNKLSLGAKTRSRYDKIKLALKSADTAEKKKELQEKYRAYSRYKRNVQTQVR